MIVPWHVVVLTREPVAGPVVFNQAEETQNPAGYIEMTLPLLSLAVDVRNAGSRRSWLPYLITEYLQRLRLCGCDVVIREGGDDAPE